MNWNKAVEEAKEELGYDVNEYVNDWDEVVELAQIIREDEYDEFCDKVAFEHREYLLSDEWKEKRIKILRRDNFLCVDCGGKATQVHHVTYTSLCSPEEEEDCTSLCRWCHRTRHGLIESKEYKYNCTYCGKGFNFYHDCSNTGQFISIDDNPEYGKLGQKTFNSTLTNHIVNLETGQTLKNKEESIPMVDATDYFGGNYLKASDIKEPTVFTIIKVEVKELEGKSKLIVSFDEIDKGFVLNKINTTRIIEWTGNKETDQWAGTKITLLATTVEYDGKDVPCIRVKKKEDGA